MNFQSINKLIMMAFVVASFFYIDQSLSAEPMIFKVGDAAFYTVTQTIDYKCDRVNAQSKSTIEFTVKILSSDPKTLSFPFDVELTMTRIQMDETNKDMESFQYDSNKPVDFKDSIWAEDVANLIDNPMYFKVNSPFDVQEITELLTKIDKHEIPTTTEILGTTPFSFEFLLTQLFHLSGKNIEQSISYPVNCRQLISCCQLVGEVKEVDEQELVFDQQGAYVITDMGLDRIQAHWQGTSKVKESWPFGLEAKYSASVRANVEWNSTNPAIQQRNMILIFQGKAPFCSPERISIRQVWTSTPL